VAVTTHGAAAARRSTDNGRTDVLMFIVQAGDRPTALRHRGGRAPSEGVETDYSRASACVANTCRSTDSGRQVKAAAGPSV